MCETPSKQYTEEANMVQSANYRPLTVFFGVVTVALLTGLIINTVIGEIQFQQQSDVGFYIGQEIVASVIGPLGLLAIAIGFWVLRAAPDLGILPVAAGSFAVAVLFFWLIIPFVIAIGVSAYAVQSCQTDADFVNLGYIDHELREAHNSN